MTSPSSEAVIVPFDMVVSGGPRRVERVAFWWIAGISVGAVDGIVVERDQ